jgi:hypothetical protein
MDYLVCTLMAVQTSAVLIAEEVPQVFKRDYLVCTLMAVQTPTVLIVEEI